MNTHSNKEIEMTTLERIIEKAESTDTVFNTVPTFRRNRNNSYSHVRYGRTVYVYAIGTEQIAVATRTAEDNTTLATFTKASATAVAMYVLALINNPGE
jgi:hypothetical protein